uniref:Adenosine deaminase, RNA-specific, B1 n=1 Tax=Mus musculus TaxID=10090 RepID=D6RGS1_MOUSE
MDIEDEENMRSCNEGVVSYSFWAPQVPAALILKKTAIWTTCPPRTAAHLGLARVFRSPTGVVVAPAGSGPWRRAAMVTPSTA